MSDTQGPSEHQGERLADPVEGARADEPAEATSAPQRGWAPPRAGRKVTLLAIGFVLAGILLVLYAWGLPPFASAIQTTDNAYVRGQTTVIAPQVNGYVVEVRVQDYDQVKRGQVLARIDDRIYRQRVEQARAQLAAQSASLANSDQSRRSSEAQLAGQAAGVANARAQLARAQADMVRVKSLLERARFRCASATRRSPRCGRRKQACCRRRPSSRSLANRSGP